LIGCRSNFEIWNIGNYDKIHKSDLVFDEIRKITRAQGTNEFVLSTKNGIKLISIEKN
jgi:hypothetical protein